MSESIKFKCSKCGQPIEVAADRCDIPVSCPACYFFSVPAKDATRPLIPKQTSFTDRLEPHIKSPTVPPNEQQVRIGPIIRDIVIVWILTAMGGLVVGLATGGRQQDPQRYIISIAAANFLLGTVAFTIVGCLAPAERWRHLGFVAIGAWFTSIINVLFFGVTVPQWIFGALFMAFIMGFGGAISYVFKKRPAA